MISRKIVKSGDSKTEIVQKGTRREKDCKERGLVGTGIMGEGLALDETTDNTEGIMKRSFGFF